MANPNEISSTITGIYRYPVKGLTPEALDRVQTNPGQTLPFDRAYAIENGPGKDGTGRFDPAHPKHLPKVNFVMLMRNEKLAVLKTKFKESNQELTISHFGEVVATGKLDQSEGRANIESYIAEYIPDELKGAPQIVFAPHHSFSDVSAKCLHIVNMNSVKELEGLTEKPVDPLRFRPNLIIDGPPAMSELDWVGKELIAGSVRMEVFKRTMRCPATNVDPASGARDMSLPDLLKDQFGHMDFGIYARIVEGGELAPGMRLSLK